MEKTQKSPFKFPLVVLVVFLFFAAWHYIDTVDFSYYSSHDSSHDSLKQEVMAEENARLTIDIPEDIATVVVGSTAVVPDWEWVNVINEVRVSSCGIEMGGVITVVKKEGASLIVEYEALGEPSGTPCSSGVQFRISEKKFVLLTSQYKQKRDKIINDKVIVKKIISKNYYGEAISAGDWRWVTVVNLEPVKQNFSNGSSYISYGDDCGCGYSSNAESGVIQERGKAPDGRILYEYTAKGNPEGTPCPSGVLFFASNY